MAVSIFWTGLFFFFFSLFLLENKIALFIYLFQCIVKNVKVCFMP